MNQLNPEYVQNFVNSSFALANSLDCVRRLPANRAEHAWFLMFPRIDEVIQVAESSVESSQQISIRIQRGGFNTWSLWIKNSFDVVQSFDTTPTPLYEVDELEGATNYFNVDPPPQMALQDIYRIEWSRDRVTHSSKMIRSSSFGITATTLSEDNINAFHRALNRNHDLILPEIDTVCINFEDLDLVREGLHGHVRSIKESRGSFAS